MLPDNEVASKHRLPVVHTKGDYPWNIGLDNEVINISRLSRVIFVSGTRRDAATFNRGSVGF